MDENEYHPIVSTKTHEDDKYGYMYFILKFDDINWCYGFSPSNPPEQTTIQGVGFTALINDY